MHEFYTVQLADRLVLLNFNTYPSEEPWEHVAQHSKQVEGKEASYCLEVFG